MYMDDVVDRKQHNSKKFEVDLDYRTKGMNYQIDSSNIQFYLSASNKIHTVKKIDKFHLEWHLTSFRELMA